MPITLGVRAKVVGRVGDHTVVRPARSLPPAAAEPGVEPAGAVALPEGPAQAWLLADLDTGAILASRNPYEPHAPASTIKPLLAMVVLDNLRPDNFARANSSHTEVECSCVGLKPGQPYTTRQLLEALLMVSGNDAANMLADMLGGQGVAVPAMNRKAAAVGARSTKASSPSGLDGPGWESITTPHDLAVIYRAALTYPLIAQIMRAAVGTVPRQDHHQPERATDPLPRRIRRQDRVHQPRPPHICRRRAAGQPPTGGGGDVRHRRPVRPGDPPVRLGFQPVPLTIPGFSRSRKGGQRSASASSKVTLNLRPRGCDRDWPPSFH